LDRFLLAVSVFIIHRQLKKKKKRSGSYLTILLLCVIIQNCCGVDLTILTEE